MSSCYIQNDAPAAYDSPPVCKENFCVDKKAVETKKSFSVDINHRLQINFLKFAALNTGAAFAFPYVPCLVLN